MDTNAVIAAKTELRSLARARRAALDARYRQAAALKVADVDLDFAGVRLGHDTSVAGFMPIGEELSPLPLMGRFAERGCRLALPVMMGKTAPLAFRAYAPGDPLEAKVWGIREPLATSPAVIPDIVLVALLAFDAAGYRLGYGGGYYDRTLRAARVRKSIVTIGLAFDEQRVDAVPHLDYDEPLDWILTPSGPLRPVN